MNTNTQNKRLSTIFFFTILIGFLLLGFRMFETFWQIIAFSVLIAVVANPAHKKIKSLIKNKTIAALVSTFLIFSFVLIPGLILTIVVVDQSLAAIPIFNKFITETKDFDYYFQNLPLLGSWYSKAKIAFLSSGVDIDVMAFVKTHIGSVANFTLDKSKSILTNIGSALVGMLFVLMTIFFFFKDGNYYYKGLYDVIPMDERDKTFLFDKSYTAIKAIFLGTILTAFVQALLGFVAYFFAGISFSLFWGFATFITAFIPLGGAAIIWLPLALYSFYSGGVVTGIIFIIWGAVVISGSDNIVRPLFIGGQTNINTLVLVFTILGGVELFGFIGIFVAPIIIVLIDNLLLLYKQKYLNINTFSDMEVSEEN